MEVLALSKLSRHPKFLDQPEVGYVLRDDQPHSHTHATPSSMNRGVMEAHDSPAANYLTWIDILCRLAQV
eukprot:9466899-Pyramimonas_sp.AAC.2